MTVVTTLPFARPLTRHDLQHLPDDGHRYELIDGSLIVSPAPRHAHQVVLGNLYVLLRLACPPDLQVVLAPFAVGLADDTEVQPDLLVAPRARFTERDLPGPPLLAVEVLSPSTRRVDLLLKRDRYQAAGIPSYWLVDPGGPSLTVLELDAGDYVERGQMSGDGSLTVQQPFPLEIVLARLVDWAVPPGPGSAALAATLPLARRAPLAAADAMKRLQRAGLPLFSPSALLRGEDERALEWTPLYAGAGVARLQDVAPAAEAVRRLTP